MHVCAQSLYVFLLVYTDKKISGEEEEWEVVIKCLQLLNLLEHQSLF